MKVALSGNERVISLLALNLHSDSEISIPTFETSIKGVSCPQDMSLDVFRL